MNNRLLRLLQNILVTVLLGANAGIVCADWYYERWPAMGTEITLQMYAMDEDEAQRIVKQLKKEIERLNQLLSAYLPESELSQVNQLAASEPVIVSKELFDLIEQSLAYSKMTIGAFDITYASVGYLYDLRNQYSPPDWQVKTLGDAIDYRHIQLNSKNASVRFLNPNVKIDLGGIAKGYTVDRCADILKKSGILDATISAGGDSRIIGRKNGRPWLVGIKHPRQKEQHALVLPLENVALSTSGDYERFYIDEAGNRQHHIISPKTGRPAKGVVSVSILGEHGIDTDALSTAVFVMGLPDGLNLINSLEGFDAVIIDDALKVHYSLGLQPPEQ